MALVFGFIEVMFFISSLSKFAKGGYFAVIMALLLFSVMLIWHRGTNVEQSQRVMLRLRDYLTKLGNLRRDESVPKCADNVVFITNSSDPELIDRDIL